MSREDQELSILRSLATAAQEYLRHGTCERELTTCLRDYDGWRHGYFEPSTNYHPALTSRGKVIS